ncbi:hypothetical protein [Sphingobacterium lactis]|uniref:Uncharacterized protein n=1 Tax=Sphingobacterium lactis TaxID=797291 RepID=A0A1H5RVF8_9SPHI|nr:hypothetical protein [Sphingobacterium lactis]SEF41688.1 hypothetical protein SAMN05421877_10165 [Sphingobacterium lactis]
MKLTPLNIALACIIVWVMSEYMSDQEPLFSWVWVLLLSLVFIFVDILFRIWFKNMQRLWMVELGFLLVVGILSILIKAQF